MPILLDTHILIWWFARAGLLTAREKRAIGRATPEDPLLISDISLWEIATLHRLGRIELAFPLRDWLERATAPPLVRRCPITPAVASEVASLPSSFPRDPADRIIVATARVLGAMLLTHDARIVASRIVPTLG